MDNDHYDHIMIVNTIMIHADGNLNSNSNSNSNSNNIWSTVNFKHL